MDLPYRLFLFSFFVVVVFNDIFFLSVRVGWCPGVIFREDLGPQSGVPSVHHIDEIGRKKRRKKERKKKQKKTRINDSSSTTRIVFSVFSVLLLIFGLSDREIV